MSSMPHTTRPGSEPTAEDLAAIETEWPLIAAELDVLDAEITILTTTHPTALDWRRLRRAQTRVIRLYLNTAPNVATATRGDKVNDGAAA